MPFEPGLLFGPIGDVHPPSVTHRALVEDQFLFVPADRDAEPGEPFAVQPGKVVGAAPEAIQEAPDHLRGELGGGAVLIHGGVQFVDPDGSDLLADPA
jgi:hypothetical protein